MVIHERKIFLYTEIVQKMTQDIEKEFFHIYLKNNQKFSVMLIVLSLCKELRKEQAVL